MTTITDAVRLAETVLAPEGWPATYGEVASAIDALARAVIAMAPVIAAAEAWLDSLESRGGHYLDGIPGELIDAIDAMRAGRDGK